MSSFTSYESSTGQYNPYPSDYLTNLGAHRADANQYEIDKQNQLDEINKKKEALGNAFYNEYANLEQSGIGPATYGWVQGFLPTLNYYNSEVNRHNKTYTDKLKFARLYQKTDGEYKIAYDSDVYYNYKITNMNAVPYYIESKAAFGGKRIKSKKRTKSRKSKKLKKTRKR
jgi:hypothetical protein